MKTHTLAFPTLLCLWSAATAALAQTPPELTLQIIGGQPSVAIRGAAGSLCQIQFLNDFASNNDWLCLTGLSVRCSPCLVLDPSAAAAPRRFYRALAAWPDLAVVPAGTFSMGDTFGDLGIDETPVHTVNVSAFYMDRTEVSRTLWNVVSTWATNNGYVFAVNSGAGKAAGHPAQRITWYDAVKWCNARSEMEGLSAAYFLDSALTQVYRSGQAAPFASWTATGYRLPTEAEWEKAARGGTAGHRFPWTDADTITHSRANYTSSTTFPFDVSPTRGFNPAFTNGVTPYTSPCGYFPSNGFGLCDMAGNVCEWCWDWYDPNWYTNAAAIQDDTQGPATGSQRVLRGGSWDSNASDARCANRDGKSPSTSVNETGFRCVRRL